MSALKEVEPVLERLKGVLPLSLYRELVAKLSKEEMGREKALEVIYETLKLYVKALIDAGEAIGIVTAQSIGEPSTQMILRSFHFAGLREFSMALGLPRMIEIVDARRRPATPLMYVYLDEEHSKSREKAEEVAKRIQSVTLETLARSVDVDYLTFSIVVELDPEQLRYRDISTKQLEKVLAKVRGKGLEVEFDGNVVVFRLDTSDPVKLRKIRDKLLQTRISGIKNVRKTVVRQDEGTGEWYIITEGSNLEAVLQIEGVDPTRTYSNDLHEVAEVLGIEAARTLIANELKKVLDEQGLDVDMRHMFLVADAMTWTGRVRQIGRHGVAGKKESPLARAAFEVTVKNLVDAATKGESEVFKGVFENIIAGRYIPVGTGMVRILMEL